MSCFIVENRTIDKIVRHLLSGGLPIESEALGRQLQALNLQAFMTRYPKYDAPPYVEPYQWSGTKYGACETWKALSCFLYQCTEGDVPETSLYQELEIAKNRLAGEIVSSLPDTRDAPWE